MSITSIDNCEGALHYTNCWWCVYNDDGRDQATGDPEIDAAATAKYNPYEMDHETFKATLAKRTTTDQLFENAPRVYDYLTELFGRNCADSVLREWSFQWWTDQTGKDYETIYQRWFHETK